MRSSEPDSVAHSSYHLLLNPPSVRVGFNASSVCTMLVNVAHFFPLHEPHLDLTFWAVPIVITVGPSLGKLKTVVYGLRGKER